MKRLLILAVLLCLGAALLQAQPAGLASTTPNIFYTAHPTRISDVTGHTKTSVGRCGLAFVRDSVYLGSTNTGLLCTIEVLIDTVGVHATDTVWVALGHDTTAALGMTQLLPSLVSGQPFDQFYRRDIPNPGFIMIKAKVNYPRQVIAY